MFHLDEYVGIPADHPASFRRYLREHLIDKTGMGPVHFLDVDVVPARRAAAPARRSRERQSTSLSSALARTPTSPSTTRPPTSTTTAPYMIVSWTKPAAASR